MNVDVYIKNGYAGRGDYLRCLASEYGLPLEQVEETAALPGPAEDFGGLVAELQNHRGLHDGWWAA